MKTKIKQKYIEFIHGNENSFSEFIEIITPIFFKMFKRLGSDNYSAEDNCQELFLKLYENAFHYNSNYELLPWIYKIARNIYFKQFNKSKKIKIIPIYENIEASNYYGPELEITSILNKLSEEKKIVFELKHFQNLKFSEISEILNIAEGTVKSRMFHAVKELKEILRREL